ncbi:MAG: hypothetical protein ACK4S4_07950 [Pyrinomonadaceae bacterium]
MKFKSLLLVPAVVAALGLSAFSQSTLIKRTTTKTDRMDFGAGGTVAVVGAPEGSITVRPARGSEVEIEARIELQAPSEADLARLAEITTFVVQEGLGRVSIISTGTHDTKFVKRLPKKLPKNLIGLPFRIDYVIGVPRYCDLEISGGRGDITIGGVEGAIRVNSLESTAKLDLVGGGLNATFGKGTVAITMPDRSWRGNAIDVQLASGTMDVRFPVNLSAELDAAILRTGKIENALGGLKPRVRTAPPTERSIAARAGAGGVSMKFTVGDGTLRLRHIGSGD